MATLWATIFGFTKVIDLSSESMVTLQERMVHLTEQLSMPLIEVSLIINRWIKALMTRLEELADEHDESLPETVTSPIPLKDNNNESKLSKSKVETMNMESVDKNDDTKFFEAIAESSLTERQNKSKNF